MSKKTGKNGEMTNPAKNTVKLYREAKRNIAQIQSEVQNSMYGTRISSASPGYQERVVRWNNYQPFRSPHLSSL